METNCEENITEFKAENERLRIENTKLRSLLDGIQKYIDEYSFLETVEVKKDIQEESKPELPTKKEIKELDSALKEGVIVIEKDGHQIEIQNPILEIQLLKVHQDSDDCTIDFRLTNKSNKFIDFWKIDADIFDANQEYLGHEMTCGENFRPGQSITGSINYFDIQIKFASWQPSISRVSVDLGKGESIDATRYYDLNEIKAENLDKIKEKKKAK